MTRNKISYENQDELYPLEMEDESVLADGMIPDSRIVRLMDELDATANFGDEEEDEEILPSLDSFEMRFDDTPYDE
ncbi:MAG: hypothetical protein LZF61_10785 [Nitrosomonas sp.]|nr:MAG: hypothetical protein LZF61_10785 [Nitrosomonas sp.]